VVCAGCMLGCGAGRWGEWRGETVPRVEVGSTCLHLRKDYFGENKVVNYGVVFCSRNVGALVILETAVAYDEPLPMMSECGLRKSSRRRPLAFGLVVQVCGFGVLSCG